MTGNVVILGMALVGGDGLPILGPLVALAFFLLGAIAGGRTLRLIARTTRQGSALAFGFVALLLAAIGTFASLSLGIEPGLKNPVVTGALGFAMGVQAATARRINIKDLPTVVITSTVTAWASESRLAGGEGPRWRRRFGAVAVVLSGAALGALLVHYDFSIGVFCAALIEATVAIAWAVSQRRGRD